MPITDIKIAPSNLFGCLVLLTTICSLFIILSLPLSFFSRAFLIVLSSTYGFYIFNQDCLMKGINSINCLYLNKDGWSIATQTAITPARICGDSTLTAFVSVLRFKVAGSKRKHSCVIFRDATSTQDYRRLLVVLRTGAGITAQ